MTAPVASAGMLIRRPVAEVFEAFVDPAITRRFWFSEGSGRLAPGARVTWTWGMYGFVSPAAVTAFEPDRRLAVDWDEGDGRVAAALDGMNGFTLVLAGAKIWLEHGIEPRFVLDRHPDMRVAEWRDQ